VKAKLKKSEKVAKENAASTVIKSTVNVQKPKVTVMRKDTWTVLIGFPPDRNRIDLLKNIFQFPFFDSVRNAWSISPKSAPDWEKKLGSVFEIIDAGYDEGLFRKYKSHLLLEFQAEHAALISNNRETLVKHIYYLESKKANANRVEKYRISSRIRKIREGLEDLGNIYARIGIPLTASPDELLVKVREYEATLPKDVYPTPTMDIDSALYKFSDVLAELREGSLPVLNSRDEIEKPKKRAHTKHVFRQDEKDLVVQHFGQILKKEMDERLDSSYQWGDESRRPGITASEVARLLEWYVTDDNGEPIIDRNGHYVEDTAKARQLLKELIKEGRMASLGFHRTIIEGSPTLECFGIPEYAEWWRKPRIKKDSPTQ